VLRDGAVMWRLRRWTRRSGTVSSSWRLPSPSVEQRHQVAYELALTMLSQHVSIDATRRHIRLLRKDSPQSRGIEGRACTQDLGFREAGKLASEMGKDVDGIGDEKEDGVG
jgi:hypothetical protein